MTSRHDEVHVVMSGERHLEFTAKANGREGPVPGNPGFDRVTVRRIDRKQVEVTERKNGATVATLRSRLSRDGKELSITTSREGHPDQVTVWTRSGGAKSASNPLDGDWTQDLGKTRMRQGLTLRIEPDGNNGVRFFGDFSYTARFDGRQYDLKNSVNDTVTLQRVDPRTVDAFYRRDNQVTQTDRWIVAADGRQMTLTSIGTLESGQHLTEKLVFRKQ